MYYFIVNPNSRSGAGKKIWERLRKELHIRGIEHQVSFTRYVGHGIELSRKFSAFGTKEDPVTLIAVGGDGTIQEVLTGIQDLEHVIFGYIPTGSGNDFCRSMKIPQTPEEALTSILEAGRIAEMDVPVLLSGKHQYRFGISAGLGYDAAVCQEVSASRIKKYLNHLGLGKLVYLVIALKQLLFITPEPMRLEMDGDRSFVFEKVYFAAVMNQKYEGGGFQFCPKADSSDGILDVILVEGVGKLKLLFCLPTALFGKHTKIRGVHTYRCKHIHLYSENPRAVHRDGEGGGVHREISVSLEKKALKVILPVL